ncbi:MAG: acyl carrier protein [Clostridia bacterium]|nr:acyl carrier protein [Clostridia bacterium]MBR2327510.1 acyl carrier protein [Clostridia bacterium]
MVFEKIAALIADQFGIDASNITKDTSFTDDLSADSLDIVELIMAIEQEFDISVNDEDVENVKTVGDVVSHIEKLVG